MKCRKSKVQEYDCQVCVKPFFSKDKFICFDKCLVNELFHIWDNGIETVGCCCGGHINNKGKGYIQVAEKDIKKMEQIGYKHQKNQFNYNNIFNLNEKTLHN